MKKVVLTGGPGCGKSSVLAELARRGYLVMPETFRWLKVLSSIESFEAPAQARVQGQDFIRRLLAFQRYVEDEETRDEFCFYDRSTLDLVAYTHFYSDPSRLSADPESISLLDNVARNFATEIHQAFLISLPQSPTEQDWLRKNTIEESALIEKQIRRSYAEYGVELVVLPRAPVPLLCNTILQYLGVRTDGVESLSSEHNLQNSRPAPAGTEDCNPSKS